MLEVLKFVFSGFWVFIGCMILLMILCDGISHVANSVFQRPSSIECPKLKSYECTLKLIRDADVGEWNRADFVVFAQDRAKRALAGEEIVGSWSEEDADA